MQIFTQWECEMAAWAADADGWPLDVLLWLGGCVNRSDFTQGFADERAERSGIPFPDLKMLEEEHRVTLENLWGQRTDEEPYVTPGVSRDARAVVVFLWVDEDSGFWVKRTYYNAQFNPFVFSSENEVFEQKIEMRAGWMFEERGKLVDGRPTLTAGAVAVVRYVSISENLPLYTYAMGSGLFTAVAPTAGRATIAAGVDGPHVFTIKFNGTKALAIKADGTLHLGSVTAIGGTFVSTLPRLDFYVGAQRIASLSSAGELATPTLQGDTAANPGLLEDFELSDGSWRASLDRTGVYAAAVEDGL